MFSVYGPFRKALGFEWVAEWGNRKEALAKGRGRVGKGGKGGKRKAPAQRTEDVSLATERSCSWWVRYLLNGKRKLSYHRRRRREAGPQKD